MALNHELEALIQKTAGELAGLLTGRHYGPGPHPGTGTRQDVHAGNGAQSHDAIRRLERMSRWYESYEEFERDFSLRNLHGTYFHLTSDPEFEIDPERVPREASTAATQSGTPGLMVTVDVENWADQLGMRPYVAVIDLSDLEPGREYSETTRGFGHEVFIREPVKAKVVDVLPFEKALELVKELYESVLPQSSGELREIYERGRSAVKRHYSPIHPGTGTDQQVHAGDGEAGGDTATAKKDPTKGPMVGKLARMTDESRRKTIEHGRQTAIPAWESLYEFALTDKPFEIVEEYRDEVVVNVGGHRVWMRKEEIRELGEGEAIEGEWTPLDMQLPLNVIQDMKRPLADFLRTGLKGSLKARESDWLAIDSHLSRLAESYENTLEIWAEATDDQKKEFQDQLEYAFNAAANHIRFITRDMPFFKKEYRRYLEVIEGAQFSMRENIYDPFYVEKMHQAGHIPEANRREVEIYFGDLYGEIDDPIERQIMINAHMEIARDSSYVPFGAGQTMASIELWMLREIDNYPVPREIGMSFAETFARRVNERGTTEEYNWDTSRYSEWAALASALEYIPGQWLPPDEGLRQEDPANVEFYTRVSQILNDAWKSSTAKPGSILMSEIASEMWGGDPIPRSRFDPLRGGEDASILESRDFRQATRDMLKGIKERTQEQLRNAGIEPDERVLLFRGLNTLGSEWDLTGHYGAGKVQMWSLSSWATSSEDAWEFSDPEQGAIVVAAIPARNLVANASTGWPCKREEEWIVNMDGPIEAAILPPGNGEHLYMDIEVEGARILQEEIGIEDIRRSLDPEAIPIDEIDWDWIGRGLREIGHDRDTIDGLTDTPIWKQDDDLEVRGILRRVIVRHGDHEDQHGRPGEVGGSQPGYEHVDGGVSEGGGADQRGKWKVQSEWSIVDEQGRQQRKTAEFDSIGDAVREAYRTYDNRRAAGDRYLGLANPTITVRNPESFFSVTMRVDFESLSRNSADWDYELEQLEAFHNHMIQRLTEDQEFRDLVKEIDDQGEQILAGADAFKERRMRAQISGEEYDWAFRGGHQNFNLIVTVDPDRVGGGSGTPGEMGVKVFWEPITASEKLKPTSEYAGGLNFNLTPAYVTMHELHHSLGSDTELDYFSDVMTVDYYLRNPSDRTGMIDKHVARELETQIGVASRIMTDKDEDWISSRRAGLKYLYDEYPEYFAHKRAEREAFDRANEEANRRQSGWPDSEGVWMIDFDAFETDVELW